MGFFTLFRLAVHRQDKKKREEENSVAVKALCIQLHCIFLYKTFIETLYQYYIYTVHTKQTWHLIFPISMGNIMQITKFYQSAYESNMLTLSYTV